MVQAGVDLPTLCSWSNIIKHKSQAPIACERIHGCFVAFMANPEITYVMSDNNRGQRSFIIMINYNKYRHSEIDPLPL